MRIQIRPYTFENDGLRLDGTIFKPPDEKDKHPAILFVHGWTSERKRSFQYAKSLADLGYICLLFDMRGHGTSGGEDPAVYAWRNQHRKSRETFALEAVSNFKSKILIIESEKDDVIPHQV